MGRSQAGVELLGSFIGAHRSNWAYAFPMNAPDREAPPDSAAVLPPDRVPDPDETLVRLAVAGDQRAFELLVRKYQRRVERLVGRMVRDHELVRDIVQESFIRAYRALPKFRGDAQFYTWLYRIAVNTAKRALMDLRRDPLVFESSMAIDGQDDETSSPRTEQSHDETPDSVLAAKEIGQMVNDAIEALPAELREALLLREMEGLSYEAIAEAMGCPIGTVRSRIFRAREAVSSKIKPLLERQTGKRW